MDAQRFRGVRNALFVSGKGLLNVKLFEFFEGFAQRDVAVEHRVDYCLELWSYLHFRFS